MNNTTGATSSNDTKQREKQHSDTGEAVMNDLEQLFELYDEQPKNKSLSEKNNKGHRDTQDRLSPTSRPGRATGREQQQWRSNNAGRPAKKQRRSEGEVTPTERCRWGSVAGKQHKKCNK